MKIGKEARPLEAVEPIKAETPRKAKTYIVLKKLGYSESYIQIFTSERRRNITKGYS